MSNELLNCLDTVSVNQTQKNKTVEGQLWGTFKALAETEGTIHLIITLKNLGLATNEVRSFAMKQVIHNKNSKTLDTKVTYSAMKSKLSDACAYAKMLRQRKNTQRNRLTRKY